MIDFMKLFTSEDVYYIVVPIVVAILGVVGNYLMSFLVHEKQWKLLRERASADRYFTHFIKSFFVGIVSYIIAIMLIFYIAFVFGSEISEKAIKIICIVCCIVFHALLIAIKDVDDGIIVFKKTYKKEALLRNVIFRIPYLYSLLFWISILCGFSIIAIRILVVVQIFYEVFICIILEGNAKFIYKHADFYLCNGEKIADISVENIKCERSWIIVTNEKINRQYRFRVRDLARVEYRE